MQKLKIKYKNNSKKGKNFSRKKWSKQNKDRI